MWYTVAVRRKRRGSRERAHALHQVLAEEADQRDDFLRSCRATAKPRRPSAAAKPYSRFFFGRSSATSSIAETSAWWSVAELRSARNPGRCGARSAAVAARRPNRGARLAVASTAVGCRGASRSRSADRARRTRSVQRPRNRRRAPSCAGRGRRRVRCSVLCWQRPSAMTDAWNRESLRARIQIRVARGSVTRHPLHAGARRMRSCGHVRRHRFPPLPPAMPRSWLRGRTGRTPARLRHDRAAPGRRAQRGRRTAAAGLRALVQSDRPDPDFQRSEATARRERHHAGHPPAAGRQRPVPS